MQKNKTFPIQKQYYCVHEQGLHHVIAKEDCCRTGKKQQGRWQKSDCSPDLSPPEEATLTGKCAIMCKNPCSYIMAIYLVYIYGSITQVAKTILVSKPTYEITYQKTMLQELNESSDVSGRNTI